MSGSDYVLTPNYSLYKPVPNADNDTWGSHLNTNADTLDALIKTVDAKAGVVSFNTRTGPVVLTTGDVTDALTFTPYNATNPAGYQTAANVTTALVPYAPLASPLFTGSPSLPAGTVAVTAAPGDNDTSIATTAFVQAVAAPFGNNTGRNLIHNGRFDVRQRGPGPFTTYAYTADRWMLAFVTDTVTITTPLPTDADRAQIGDESSWVLLQAAVTGNAAAGAYSQVQQFMEDLRRFGGKTVTFSCWAKAVSGVTKLGVNLYQSFGTGGSPSAGSFVAATGASLGISSTWSRVSATLTVPSMAGKTFGTNGNDALGLSIALSSGATNNVAFGNIGVQSGTVQLWGVQLEIGSIATPLAKRDPADELALCQRFYQTGHVQVNMYGQSGLGLVYQLPVTMRAMPTTTSNFVVQTNCSGSAINGDTANSVQHVCTITSPGLFNSAGTFTASADL